MVFFAFHVVRFVQSISVFGSVARGDISDDSDVDIYVTTKTPQARDTGPGSEHDDHALVFDNDTAPDRPSHTDRRMCSARSMYGRII